MKKLIDFTVLVGLVLSLVACGGGGGGGDSTSSSSSSSTIKYSGSSSAANIDSTNASSIAGDSTTSGGVGGTAGSLAALDNAQTKTSGTSIISLAAVEAVKNELNQSDANRLTAATSTKSSTLNGACGGTETFSINIDSTTKDFSGSITFNDYCEDNVTISGSATLSGNVDTSISNITLTMTFTNLLVEDSAKKKTFKADNYTISINDDYATASFTVSLSGKFYHPDYGYVLLTTISPLQYGSSSNWPSSGKLKITEDGTAPVDSATLTVLDTTQYQLDFDKGNDGTVDSSTIGNWADL